MDNTNREAAQLRNARRRQRYSQDVIYRRHQIKMRRESSRKKARVRERDSTENLTSIKEYMTKREVTYLGSLRTMSTLSIPQFAALAGYTLQVVYRWIENGQLPPPVALGSHPEDTPYYTKKEAVAIARELSKHQESVSYYRVDHTETRRKIAEAVGRARA